MVWYKVGSIDEPQGLSGIAHFLEHLMFKGTESIPAGEFSKIVSRNGGQDNAFTSYDYTGYFQSIAADRLELVMRLEADRMRNLVLDPAEIETERAVVLEERRTRTDNSPAARLREQASAAFYMGLLGAAFGIGFTIGPAVGGFAVGGDNPDFVGPAYISAGCVVVGLLITLLLVKEPARHGPVGWLHRLGPGSRRRVERSAGRRGFDLRRRGGDERGRTAVEILDRGKTPYGFRGREQERLLLPGEMDVSGLPARSGDAGLCPHAQRRQDRGGARCGAHSG